VVEREPIVKEEADATEEDAERNLIAFGSSEFANVVLGAVWGQPPGLDLEAEARLQGLLGDLAWNRLLHSACDVSDGGIAVALAQAAFANRVGATVEQDASLMAHPLFGFFAEPASTLVVTAATKNVSAIEEFAQERGFNAARVGTTGGSRLEILVDREILVSVPIEELARDWSSALEANLHDEVCA
jgi:phosphoribosylformylglycinamidine synthase subunit PurL